MIKHIVTWKIKENAEGRNKKEIMLLLQQKLLELQNKVPVVKHLEVGLNSTEAPADNWDVVLIVDLDNFQDLDLYQKHPEHLKVADFVKLVRESRSCVDFEY
jgi:hypothetical protein